MHKLIALRKEACVRLQEAPRGSVLLGLQFLKFASEMKKPLSLPSMKSSLQVYFNLCLVNLIYALDLPLQHSILRKWGGNVFKTKQHDTQHKTSSQKLHNVKKQ